MAKAYDRKALSIISGSKYSKELQPYFSEIRDFLQQRFNLIEINTDAKLLGSGTEGEAWSITDQKVLKILRNRTKYDKERKLIKLDHSIQKYRPLIFDIITLNDKLHLVIMEKLKVFEEYDLELDILIGDISYRTEQAIRNRNFSFSINKIDISVKKLKSEVVKLIDESDIPKIYPGILFFRYQLGNNWYQCFIEQIIYLHLTNQSDDLYLNNLGISQVTKNLIFFDW